LLFLDFLSGAGRGAKQGTPSDQKRETERGGSMDTGPEERGGSKGGRSERDRSVEPVCPQADAQTECEGSGNLDALLIP